MQIYQFIEQVTDIKIYVRKLRRTNLLGVWRLPPTDMEEAAALIRELDGTKRGNSYIHVLPFEGNIDEEDDDDQWAEPAGQDQPEGPGDPEGDGSAPPGGAGDGSGKSQNGPPPSGEPSDKGGNKGSQNNDKTGSQRTGGPGTSCQELSILFSITS